MSVDLPEPETPLTHTSSPTGSARSMFLRLFPRAPFSFRTRARSKRRRVFGPAISSVPERYWPGGEAGGLGGGPLGGGAPAPPPALPPPPPPALDRAPRGVPPLPGPPP